MSRLYIAHEWLLENSPAYANAERECITELLTILLLLTRYAWTDYEKYFEGKRGLFSEQLFSYNQTELQKIEHEVDVQGSMCLTFGDVS